MAEDELDSAPSLLRANTAPGGPNDASKASARTRAATDAEGGGEGAGHIKVCVRTRPFNKVEIDEKSKACVAMPNNTTVALENPTTGEKKEFAFDRAYWSMDPSSSNFASQQTLMDELGQDLRDNALEGFNNCLFAYGQTGSGKTHSVLGQLGAVADKEQRGLLPRIIEDMFHTIEELKKDKEANNTFSTTVSYLEIYNETLRDLLAPPNEPPAKLEIHHNPKVGCWVTNIKDVPVFSWHEVEEWLDFGVKNRAVGSTMMNATSSRSHCIFSLEIARSMTNKQGKEVQLRAKVHLVDLAGSERSKKTGATGDRMKEGNKINQSLSTLAQVISKLAEASGSKKKKNALDFIPFRNSKLTYVLMDSLNGNSKTVMVAALSPASYNYDETLGTLLFAQSVKAIKLSAKKNETTQDHMLTELEKECERLRNLVDSGAGGQNVSELAAMESLKTKYGQDVETQLQVANQLKKERENILEDSGLSASEMSKCVGLDESTPQLVNVSFDTELNGCLVYFLQKDAVTRIGSDADCTIVLNEEGLGVQGVMAEIENSENLFLQITLVRGRVLLNGCQLRKLGKEKICHNDRLIVGYAACFRVVIPDDRSAHEDVVATHAREKQLLDGMFEQAMSEVVPDKCDAYRQCQVYVQDLEGKVGHLKAQAFLQTFARLSSMVEEANEITRTVRPQERLQFWPEVIMDLLGAGGDVPHCVVRLTKLQTGKARFKNIVQEKIVQKTFLQKVMREMNIEVSTSESARNNTIIIMNMPDFKERLQHLREAYDAHKRGVLDLSKIEQNPWEEVTPWAMGDYLDDREAIVRRNCADRMAADEQRIATAKAAFERLREANGSFGSETKWLREELDRAEVREEKKNVRIRELEAQVRDLRSQARLSNANASASDGLRGSGNAPVNGSTSRQISTREEAYKVLLSKIPEAFNAGLKRDAEESRALSRHMQRIEACEAAHFNACKALREEVTAELSDEMRESTRAGDRLRGEATGLRMSLAKVESQLAEQNSGSRAAVELAEHYMSQSNGFRTPNGSQARSPSEGQSPTLGRSLDRGTPGSR